MPSGRRRRRIAARGTASPWSAARSPPGAPSESWPPPSATCARRGGEPVHLWLFSKTGPAGSGDGLFYLPLTGLDESDLHVLATATEITEPFRWLPPFMASKAQAIYNRLLELRPRVLHLSLDEANLAGGIAAVMAGVPRIVLHCHNMRPSNLHHSDEISFGWDRAYRALLSRENVVFVNVADIAVQDYLAWFGGSASAQTRTIRNGFDFTQFGDRELEFLSGIRSELGIPAGAPVVGTALRFTAVKQPSVWLEMAARVAKARPDVHFVLYGDGQLLEESREQARRLGLGENVHFPGRVNDLYRRLPLMDLFVLSSRSEGLPNVLIEAQALGVVPVTFDVGGCRETLDEGETGVLVREQTADALAAAVLDLVDDPERRAAMAVRGRGMVRQRFAIERMLGDIAAVILGEPAADSQAS